MEWASRHSERAPCQPSGLCEEKHTCSHAPHAMSEAVACYGACAGSAGRRDVRPAATAMSSRSCCVSQSMVRDGSQRTPRSKRAVIARVPIDWGRVYHGW